MYLRGEKNASEVCGLPRPGAELRARRTERGRRAPLALAGARACRRPDALASSVELPASHSRTSCSAGTTAASSRALGASE